MEILGSKTETTWKEKAISRQRLNKDLRKRIKESRLSRNQWKEKALERKKEINKLKDEIDWIKKNLTKIIKKK